MEKQKLETVLDWAHSKAQQGDNPPWALYEYMKLIDALQSIIKGMEATSPTGSLLPPASHRGEHLRLVDAKYQPNTSPRHQEFEDLQMPT